ncbi:MAG: hypothetical protein JW963_08940 [Anaerolineales bacterium]|nr:hypothetical protein [Anaerolineales bacterium]
MNSSQNARLKRLEAEMKTRGASGCWVDWVNNRVRVDVHLKSGSVKRGEEMTFDSVRACADWVEARLQDSEKVTGTCWIEDISELFTGEHKQALQTAFVEGEQRCALMNLNGVNVPAGIAPYALATWLEGKRAMAGNYIEKSPCDLVTRGLEKFTILALLADQMGAQFPELTEWDSQYLNEDLAQELQDV